MASEPSDISPLSSGMPCPGEQGDGLCTFFWSTLKMHFICCSLSFFSTCLYCVCVTVCVLSHLPLLRVCVCLTPCASSSMCVCENVCFFSPSPSAVNMHTLVGKCFFMCIINYYSFMCQGACTELMALFFQLQNVRISHPPPLSLSLLWWGTVGPPLLRIQSCQVPSAEPGICQNTAL